MVPAGPVEDCPERPFKTESGTSADETARPIPVTISEAFVARKLKRNDLSRTNAIGFLRTGLGWQVTPSIFCPLSCREDPSGLTPAKGLPRPAEANIPYATVRHALLSPAQKRDYLNTLAQTFVFDPPMVWDQIAMALPLASIAMLGESARPTCPSNNSGVPHALPAV